MPEVLQTGELTNDLVRFPISRKLYLVRLQIQMGEIPTPLQNTCQESQRFLHRESMAFQFIVIIITDLA